MTFLAMESLEVGAFLLPRSSPKRQIGPRVSQGGPKSVQGCTPQRFRKTGREKTRYPWKMEEGKLGGKVGRYKGGKVLHARPGGSAD